MQSWQDNSGQLGYIGPTFDNGDGTDSWCLNFKKLPAGMITDINKYYRNQQFATTHIFVSIINNLVKCLENLKHSRRPFIIKCCGGSKCSSSFKHKPPLRSSDLKTNNTTILKKASTPEHFQTAETKNESREYENRADPTPSEPNQNYPIATETISSDQGIASSETEYPKSTSPAAEAKTTLTTAAKRKEDFQDSCLPLKCNKDSTVFDANGKIKDGEKYGKWTRTCDKSYLFSNKLGTWQQNWDFCCSLGMHPIWFNSASDFECLSNSTKANWTQNWNYWTAGHAMGTWGQWAWCPGAVNLPDSLSWAPGQPDNAQQPDENCLHLQVTKNSSGVVLSDRNCSHKYIIACQESFFTKGIIKDLFVHGQWNAGCGKDYLFSAATLDWLGAWNYCCSVGMKLASIEAIEELSCLTNMVAKYPKAAYPDQCGRDFWTSGTNRGCPGSHFWCSDDEKLNKEEIANWKNGILPSESADQCIFINLSNSTLSETYLGAASCTEQKPFLCEALQPGKKSMQIERTCKEIWNVTDKEVNDIIMNPSGDVVNQRRNLKCYLRCCGKKGHVIKSGSLVTDQILRNLEDLTADDPQAMQNGFQNFDSCASLQSTDECNTTAQVFGCGKKNAPDLTIGIVTANKGDATVSVTATGGIKTSGRLCSEYPAASCVPNQANIDELKNTGKSSLGVLMTSSTGKKYFKTHLHGLTDAQAEAQCCAFGTHLAIFESLEDFKAFVQSWQDNSRYWVYIGPTFDNGDGTDSWCLNFKRLPTGLITDINTFYRNQQWSLTHIFVRQGAELELVSKEVGAHHVLCGPLPF
ncbi:uncharacterized protein LOC135940828 [Cloeon dipterum]|uniref:uncharacterized protein LOC135940828 n=1 Tax=Cloeon dipterum TaxID=197152 RepID=UPI0032205971